MNQNLRSVKKYVSGIRRKQILSRIFRGLLTCGGLFFTISFLLEFFFIAYPWIALPLLWDASVVCCFFFVVGWTLDCLFFHAPPLITTAHLLEQHSNILHPYLSIALELEHSVNQNSFIEQVYLRASEQIKNLRVPAPKRRLITLLFPATGLLWAGTLFFSPNPLLSFWKMPFSFLNSSEAEIYPGSVSVPRGAPVRVTLQPGGTPYPSCRISIINADQRRYSRILRIDSSGFFSSSFDHVQQSFSYQFSYGGKTYGPEEITVIPPPSLMSLQIHLKPPAYTGSQPRVLSEGQGDFEAYAGTETTFRIESNVLSHASICTEFDTISLSRDGSFAEGKLTVHKETGYTFTLIDTFQQSNDSLPVFRITIIPDDKPMVHFLKPGFNKELTPALTESLWVEGIDDLGIRLMHIGYCRNGECNDTSSLWNISPRGTPRVVRKQLIWDLRDLSLYPGDTLFYWATIRDSRPFKPFQTSSSDTFWFRVPGFEEIHRKIAEQENYAKETIEGVRKEQDNIDKMLEQLMKPAGKKQELSWDQQQIMQDVKKSIKAQADSLQHALQSLQENVKKLQDEGVLNDELVKKMDQIQKSLQELINQFGDSLLSQLDKQQEISMQEMRQAVESMKEMLPELNERLENTLQFLEMLKRDREMAALAMQAEKLAREQADLANAQQDKRTLDQQKDLLQRIDDLKQQLKSSENSTSFELQSSHQLDSLHKEMQSQISSQQHPSKQSMNNMSGTLATLSEELKSMTSAAKQQQMQAERNQLLDLPMMRLPSLSGRPNLKRRPPVVVN